MAEQRVSIIGTKQAGKTTIIGLLDLATSKRLQGDRTFTALIEEKTSGAMDVADLLCNGRFPDRTPMGQVYEADFVMHWKLGFPGRTLRLRLPIVEMAGEDLAKLIESHSEGMYSADPTKKFDAWSMYQYVLQSNGFIFVIPCTELRGLAGYSLEEGPAPINADTNMTRLISTIVEYKERTRSPSIKGAVLLLHKYDLVRDQLLSENINLSHPDPRVQRDAITRFLIKYLRNTYRLIKFYPFFKNIFTIPSWVDLEYDKKTGQPVLNSDGKPRVKVDFNTGLPFWSGHYYDNMISWLRETFAS